MDLLEFRPMTQHDYERVVEIYNYYIANTTVTNDTEQKTLADIEKQIPIGKEGYYPYAIYYENKMAGYVYLAPYSQRKAFSVTATVSIYLDKKYEGRKIGKRSLMFIMERGRAAGLHSLIAHINGKNGQSMAIFEKTDFVRVGYMKECGFKFGAYQDTAIYQHIL